MAGRSRRPQPDCPIEDLRKAVTARRACGRHRRPAYTSRRMVVTLAGPRLPRPHVRPCRDRGCPPFGIPYRPNAEDGLVRRHARRSTGCNAAAPELALRGPTRVAAGLGTRFAGRPFAAAELTPRDPAALRAVRATVARQRKTRVLQCQFGQNPADRPTMDRWVPG